MSQFRHQLLGIIEPQGPICKLLQVISYQLKLANATVILTVFVGFGAFEVFFKELPDSQTL